MSESDPTAALREALEQRDYAKATAILSQLVAASNEMIGWQTVPLPIDWNEHVAVWWHAEPIHPYLVLKYERPYPDVKDKPCPTSSR